MAALNHAFKNHLRQTLLTRTIVRNLCLGKNLLPNEFFYQIYSDANGFSVSHDFVNRKPKLLSILNRCLRTSGTHSMEDPAPITVIPCFYMSLKCFVSFYFIQQLNLGTLNNYVFRFAILGDEFFSIRHEKSRAGLRL